MKIETSGKRIGTALTLLTFATIGMLGCRAIPVTAVNPEPGAFSQPDPEEGDTKGAGWDEIGGIEVGIEPTPTPHALTYTNEAYGFAFDYPETWTLAEEDHGVILKKGANRLGVHFRWVDEDVDPYFGRTGMPGGDLLYADKFDFLGQVIPAHELFFEEKTKAVLYGETGMIESGDLVFMIVLEDLETAYPEVDLSEEVIEESRAILESFVRVDTSATMQR